MVLITPYSIQLEHLTFAVAAIVLIPESQVLTEGDTGTICLALNHSTIDITVFLSVDDQECIAGVCTYDQGLH